MKDRVTEAVVCWKLDDESGVKSIEARDSVNVCVLGKYVL